MSKTFRNKLILAGVSVFLQALLNSVTTIVIFMELYFFPWLVKVGQIPYKDFFDHHGFLIYLLLAPLALAGDVSLLKWLTIVISAVNLLLFLFLLRKYSVRIMAVGATLFILFSYVMVQNTLSYDLFLMPVFLGVAALLQVPAPKHSSLVGVALGTLIASVSLIKFLPGLLVLALVLYFRKAVYYVLGVFFLSWMAALSYLVYFGALSDFIDGYFRFNTFLLWRMPLIKFDGLLDPQLPILAVLGTVLAAAFRLAAHNSRVIGKDGQLYWALILSALPFLASGIHVGHLLALFPFVLLLFLGHYSELTRVKKKSWSVLLIVLVVALVLIAGRTFRHLNFRVTEYVNDPISASIISLLQQRKLERKRLFINAGYINVYYLLDNPSLHRYPMKFPLMPYPKLEEFNPDYEASLIRSLVDRDVEVVVWVTRPYQQWGELRGLHLFVQHNYQLVEKVDTPVVKFVLYQKSFRGV